MELLLNHSWSRNEDTNSTAAQKKKQPQSFRSEEYLPENKPTWNSNAFHMITSKDYMP